MNKHGRKKIQLTKETLRLLKNSDYARVAGAGLPPSDVFLTCDCGGGSNSGLSGGILPHLCC